MTIADTQIRVVVSDPSQVGEARRSAARVSAGATLDEAAAGSVAIVVNELATNMLRHAGSGEIITQGSAGGVEILAIDKGPGMDVDRCMSDGYSTGGTKGEGLGAVRRLSTEFQVYSRRGLGTVVRSRVGAPEAASGVRVGAVTVPYPGETICGDAWKCVAGDGEFAVMVVDGLGHGTAAAIASHAAIRAFERSPGAPPHRVLSCAHDTMAGTRGGAVAAVHVDLAAGKLRFSGVGNISAMLSAGDAMRGLMSHNGTVGAQIPHIKELEFPWAKDSLLILHSDGLNTRWKLEDYAGLRHQHPSIIAGVLYRDFRRGRDDATVVVLADVRKTA